MDELEADDEALYSTWDRLTPEQVDALHALVDYLGARWDETKAGHPVVAMAVLVLIARHLATFDLRHLPSVREVLEAE